MEPSPACQPRRGILCPPVTPSSSTAVIITNRCLLGPASAGLFFAHAGSRALVDAYVARADDGQIAFARTVHDNKVDGERKAAVDQLLGDGALLAALGLDELDPPIPY